MSTPRAAFILLFAGLTAAALYLSAYGVGGESSDARSFRERSLGGPGYGGFVK